MEDERVDFFSSTPDAWAQTVEGQLAVDIFRESDHLVIRSTMAGVSPENLDIAIDGDLLTIRGQREEQRLINEDDWFTKECYWGSFSRTIVLPMDVYSEQAAASLKNGVLEIRFPIRSQGQPIKIRTIEE